MIRVCFGECFLDRFIVEIVAGIDDGEKFEFGEVPESDESFKDAGRFPTPTLCVVELA